MGFAASEPRHRLGKFLEQCDEIEADPRLTPTGKAQESKKATEKALAAFEASNSLSRAQESVAAVMATAPPQAFENDHVEAKRAKAPGLAPQLHHLSTGLASAVDDGADSLGDLPQWIDVEVGVARRRAGLGMPEKLADDRQRRTARSRHRGE